MADDQVNRVAVLSLQLHATAGELMDRLHASDQTADILRLAEELEGTIQALVDAVGNECRYSKCMASSG